MRVNPNPLADLLSALNHTQQQITNDLGQIASGQRVNTPADDPAAAATLVRNADQTSADDQYLRSIASVQGELQNADSALSSVVTALQRAISLGTEGANGTLNDSDRQALAGEVKGIQSQILGLANLSYQGRYVFAGTATQTAPFVADSTSSSGVRYIGNNGVNQLTVGDHTFLQTNMPGSQLFSGGGNDMFQAVQDVVNALESNGDVASAVNKLSGAYEHINAQRVFFGNTINQLNAQQSYLNSESTQLEQQSNQVGGAELPRAISDLTNAQTSRQATLEAIAQTQQTNLFNYIK